MLLSSLFSRSTPRFGPGSSSASRLRSPALPFLLPPGIRRGRRATSVTRHLLRLPEPACGRCSGHVISCSFSRSMRCSDRPESLYSRLSVISLSVLPLRLSRRPRCSPLPLPLSLSLWLLEFPPAVIRNPFGSTRGFRFVDQRCTSVRTYVLHLCVLACDRCPSVGSLRSPCSPLLFSFLFQSFFTVVVVAVDVRRTFRVGGCHVCPYLSRALVRTRYVRMWMRV